jgi:hypothetical protein
MPETPRTEDQLGAWFKSNIEQFGINRVYCPVDGEEAFIFFRLGQLHCFYQLYMTPKHEVGAVFLAFHMEKDRLLLEEYNPFTIEHELMAGMAPPFTTKALLTALSFNLQSTAHRKRQQLLFHHVCGQIHRFARRRGDAIRQLYQWVKARNIPTEVTGTAQAERCTACVCTTPAHTASRRIPDV